MQSRHVIPGWFGVGYALERFSSGGEQQMQLLIAMMGRFPFFHDLIRNVELALTKVDLPLARSVEVEVVVVVVRLHRRVVVRPAAQRPGRLQHAVVRVVRRYRRAAGSVSCESP